MHGNARSGSPSGFNCGPYFIHRPANIGLGSRIIVVRRVADELDPSTAAGGFFAGCTDDVLSSYLVGNVGI